MWDLSSLTRDWTHVPCIARWILHHWTTEPGKSQPWVLNVDDCICLFTCVLFDSRFDKSSMRGNSLVVQWLRHNAPNARGMNSIPHQGTKILRAALQGQKKKKNSNDTMRGIFSVQFLGLIHWGCSVKSAEFPHEHAGHLFCAKYFHVYQAYHLHNRTVFPSFSCN